LKTDGVELDCRYASP